MRDDDQDVVLSQYILQMIGLGELHDYAVGLRKKAQDPDYRARKHIEQEKDEELPVEETDAVVNPWAVMIHVQHAAVTC